MAASDYASKALEIPFTSSGASTDGKRLLLGARRRQNEMSGAVFDGVIATGGPAIAGLVMLAQWSAVALITPGKRGLGRVNC
jgi:hypothetical protein